MSRRIVEQCGRADFSSLEHLASSIDKSEQLDTSTLTKTQKAAIRFLIVAQEKKIPFCLVKDTVKEVLFWSSDGKMINGIEIKWLQHKDNIEKVKRFKMLWQASKTRHSNKNKRNEGTA